MKTRNTSLSIILVLVVSVILVGAALNADAFGRKGADGNKRFEQRGQDMGERMLKRLAKELDLTQEQQEEIAVIMAKFQVAQMNKMKEAAPRGDLMQQMLKEEFDEAKIREAYQAMKAEREKMREDRFVERAKLMADIKAVLTDEQVKLLQEKAEKFLEEGPRHPMSRRGGMADGPEGPRGGFGW